MLIKVFIKNFILYFKLATIEAKKRNNNNNNNSNNNVIHIKNDNNLNNNNKNERSKSDNCELLYNLNKKYKDINNIKTKKRNYNEMIESSKSFISGSETNNNSNSSPKK